MTRPTSAQVREELQRRNRRIRFRQTLQSTLCCFTTLAAGAVLAAALWFPVLQVRSDVLSPRLHSGDLVLCCRTDLLQPGDIAACFEGNTLLLRQCISGEGDPVILSDTDGSPISVRREQIFGRVLLQLWPLDGFMERGI